MEGDKSCQPHRIIINLFDSSNIKMHAISHRDQACGIGRKHIECPKKTVIKNI